MVERVAKSSLTVLIQGETGSGKEVMAETIHRLSPRASQPLLRLNCAAISDTLMESELFGHERGAFTGAVTPKPGLLETAEGGTVFLDEIGDMGLLLQAKLLRVLEERKVWRVGALKPRDIDVRFLAATNRDLEQATTEGKFRQDLLFRLNAVTLRVPSLRERTNEIEALSLAFIAEGCRAMGRPPLELDGSALQALLRYPWPGNIRELRNVIGRVVATCEGPSISESDLGLRPDTSRSRASIPPGPPASSGGGRNLHEDVEALEEDRILKALKATGYNRTKTAQALGIARNTLASRMARFNIRVPDPED
jgi:DNA-binding NtrC family response regulator